MRHVANMDAHPTLGENREGKNRTTEHMRTERMRGMTRKDMIRAEIRWNRKTGNEREERRRSVVAPGWPFYLSKYDRPLMEPFCGAQTCSVIRRGRWEVHLIGACRESLIPPAQHVHRNLSQGITMTSSNSREV